MQSWDPLTGTEVLDLGEVTMLVNVTEMIPFFGTSHSVLSIEFTNKFLVELIGFDYLRHPERFRLGLRAVNHAGLRSGPCMRLRGFKTTLAAAAGCHGPLSIVRLP